MWQKDTADIDGDGQISEEPEGGDLISWQDALKYCENLNSAGHMDWRLPNVRELQSIIDYDRFDPAIDPVFYAMKSWYWSSTVFAKSPTGAWGVGFISGDIGGSQVAPDVLGYVRAVRGLP